MKLEWKTCLKVGVSIFVLYLCIHYWQPVMAVVAEALGAASPLLIGCVIAYPINILMSFYERKFFPRATQKGIVAVRRPICMLLAIITLVAVIALIMVLIVPQLISCVQVIFAELPGAITDLVAWLDKYDFLPDNILDKLMEVDWNSRIGQIIEVLTHRVSGRYLTYLQTLGIPYIFAGDTEIDMEEALFKLKAYFGIQKLLLEGGSILNGAFQRAGVIDELSLVVAPIVAEAEDKPLFLNSNLENYVLEDVQYRNGALWLNYRKN